jgi:hypothetical protein
MTLASKTSIKSGATNSLATLYVEGKEESLDPTVLKALFSNPQGKNVVVRPVGSCHSVTNVAEAFRSLEENWFFLADRDHYHYNEIEELRWDQFSEGKTNLLRWHKRELENYFLDSIFLVQLHNLDSNDGKKIILEASKDEIENRVLAICQKRFFLDVVNYVIASLRIEIMKMRDEWLEPFRNSDVDKCHTRGDSLQALLKLDAWKKIQGKANQCIDPSEVEQRFNYYHRQMVGDSSETLAIGKGQWLNMVSGKDVLNELVNNTGIFLNNVTVKDVAQQLLRIPDVKLPNDFIDLRETVIRRTKQIIK